MSETSERRRTPRAKTTWRIRYRVIDPRRGRYLSGHFTGFSKNVGEGGASFVTPEHLSVGDSLEVEVFLTAKDDQVVSARSVACGTVSDVKETPEGFLVRMKIGQISSYDKEQLRRHVAQRAGDSAYRQDHAA